MHLSARHKTILSKLCFFLGTSISLLETFYSTGAVDKFLFARIKRMAFVANIDMCAFNCRTSFNHVTARARKRCIFVFRMDFFLHVRPPDQIYLEIAVSRQI